MHTYSTNSDSVSLSLYIYIYTFTYTSKKREEKEGRGNLLCRLTYILLARSSSSNCVSPSLFMLRVPMQKKKKKTVS